MERQGLGGPNGISSQFLRDGIVGNQEIKYHMIARLPNDTHGSSRFIRRGIVLNQYSRCVQKKLLVVLDDCLPASVICVTASSSDFGLFFSLACCEVFLGGLPIFRLMHSRQSTPTSFRPIFSPSPLYSGRCRKEIKDMGYAV